MVCNVILILTLAQPGIPALVDGHVRDLGSRVFRVRERAEAELLKLCRNNPAARAHLQSVAAQDLDVRRRVEGILAELVAERRRWILATIQSRYGDHLPMIDACWLDTSRAVYDPLSTTSRLRHFAHARLRDYLANAVPRPGDRRHWPQYREATYAWYVDLLDAGCPVPMLDILFIWMRWADNLWIRSLGAGHDPDPYHWPGVQPPPVGPLLPSPML